MIARLSMFCALLFAAVVAKAHDPHSSYTDVRQIGDVWKVSINLETSSLVSSMNAYFQTDTIVFATTAGFEQLFVKYLSEHMIFEVNKHFKVVITDFDINLNSHASTVAARLKEVPAKPMYWDIKVNYCQELGKYTNMVNLHLAGGHKLLTLDTSNDFGAIVMQDEEGQLRVK